MKLLLKRGCPSSNSLTMRGWLRWTISPRLKPNAGNGLSALIKRIADGLGGQNALYEKASGTLVGHCGAADTGSGGGSKS